MHDKIKIFTTYKDKHKIIETDIIKPIQTGRAVAGEVFEDMLGDDTGDNISRLNTFFCELSAIYWVWKNYDKAANPDYVGFMHYRRHFLFGNKNYKPDFYGLVKFTQIDENYFENDLTNDENIRKIICGNDAIIPNPINIQDEAINNYAHYQKYHNIKDLEKAYEIIKEKYPEYEDIINEYNNSHFAYFLDMFIFKKEIFFRYCEWLFSILFELKKHIDIYSQNQYQRRALGFISERLTGIFFLKLYKENCKIKTLPVSFIENTEVVENEKSNAVAVVVSSSNEYIPYLSVFLQSLTEHCNPQNVYEINILEQNITNENKKKIIQQISNNNIKVNFVNMKQSLQKFNKLCEDRHFTVDTYSRFFIPKLLPQYDKCLYLDIDMLVLADVKELFDTDMEGNSIGACRDAIMNGLYEQNRAYMQKYFKETLNMDSPQNYFQGGVSIMNCEKMRRENTMENLINLALSKKVLFVDQCITNMYFKNDIKYIDMSWNYEIEHFNAKKIYLVERMPLNIMQQYLQAKANPKIIHYAGDRKPWTYPDEEYAEIWWSYARKTPFYEEILKRMTISGITLPPPPEKLVISAITPFTGNTKSYKTLLREKKKIVTSAKNTSTKTKSKGNKYKKIFSGCSIDNSSFAAAFLCLCDNTKMVPV